MTPPPLRKGDQSLLNPVQMVHLKLIYLHKKNKSPYPTRRLPPVPSNGEDDDRGDNLDESSPPAPEVTPAPKPDPTPTKKKGTFTTKSHALRKKYMSRKYICRMCPHRSDSARDLTRHHREKAWNNSIAVFAKRLLTTRYVSGDMNIPIRKRSSNVACVVKVLISIAN